MHEDIGLGKQPGESLASCWIPQIESGTALSKCDIRHDSWLVPPGRIDAKNICAEAGQESSCNGAGNYACEIEYTNAKKRPVCPAWPVDLCACAGRCHMQERLVCDCLALRIRRPFGAGVHRRGAPSGFDDRRFQRIG